MSGFKRLRPHRANKRPPSDALAPTRRGNGNRAVWQDLTILDGAIYRLPGGELVRASVVPHPDALPEYWEDIPGTDDAWPRGCGLTLNVRWHEEGDAGGSVGPALLTFMTAPCAAGVPWAGGKYECDRDLSTRVLRHAGEDAAQAAWTVRQLRPASAEEEKEFTAAIKRADAALRRLTQGTCARR